MIYYSNSECNHPYGIIYNIMIPVLMEKNIGRNYLTIGGIFLKLLYIISAKCENSTGNTMAALSIK